MGVIENVAEGTPRGESTLRRLFRDTLLLAAVFVLLAAVFGPAFGPFVRKKGVFFHGVRSQGEYDRIRSLRHGGADDRPMPLEQEHVVRIDSDGSGQMSSATTFAYTGKDRTATLEKMYGCDGPARIETLGGMPLKWERRKEDESATFIVQLPPGVERFVLRGTFPLTPALTRAGSRWIYDFKHMYGPPIWYRHVVLLPPGATILDLHPAPLRKSKSSQKGEVKYEQELGTDFWGTRERFECRLVLALPAL